MVRPSRRGGVPVFRRPAGSAARAAARRASSPADRRRARPRSSAGRRGSARTGTCRWSARRRRPRSARPSCVTTPVTRASAPSPSSVRSSTACWNSVRFGWFSRRRADRLLVEHAIGLRARRAHGRALARVEDAELDAGLVGGDRHRAAQRVDLLDQVALADAADRRVARHLPERLDVVREQQRARGPSARWRAPPRCRHGRRRRRSRRNASGNSMIIKMFSSILARVDPSADSTPMRLPTKAAGSPQPRRARWFHVKQRTATVVRRPRSAALPRGSAGQGVWAAEGLALTAFAIELVDRPTRRQVVVGTGSMASKSSRSFLCRLGP